MYWWQWVIIIELIHNVVGMVLTVTWCTEFDYAFSEEYIIWDNLNPIYIYNRRKVNWFGATILCIFANLLSPITSICYWVYKLCTIGRK